ncbi:MAG: hypothetical protein ACUVTN_02395 [Thermodesulfobacteriota bacterium]
MKRRLLFFILFFLFDLSQISAEVKPSLIIIPFIVEKNSICPICRIVFRRGKILSGAQNTLTKLLYQKMEEKGLFKILPLEKVEETLSKKEIIPIEEKFKSSLIQIGRELGGDFLLLGFLFRFEQRVGSPWGAERPASVAFDLHLFRLRDEREVWRGRMDETQRPLSENLFKLGSFLRRRARWLTAEELSNVGMDEVLARLPGLNELEEMR